MSIKLIAMKSGEQIIADIQEMVVDNKSVGYYLTKPCGIRIVSKDENQEEVLINNSSKKAFDITLYPWMPLSKEKSIPITFDAVVTLVDPIDTLLDMYETGVVQSAKVKEVEND